MEVTLTLVDEDNSMLIKDVTKVGELGGLIYISVEQPEPETTIVLSIAKKHTTFYYNTKDIKYMKVEE
tara:strand:+ start:3241 stop:3444 length:204 start_codon:yes stop_codon:yes gene_type:complete